MNRVATKGFGSPVEAVFFFFLGMTVQEEINYSNQNKKIWDMSSLVWSYKMTKSLLFKGDW